MGWEVYVLTKIMKVLSVSAISNYFLGFSKLQVTFGYESICNFITTYDKLSFWIFQRSFFAFSDNFVDFFGGFIKCFDQFLKKQKFYHCKAELCPLKHFSMIETNNNIRTVQSESSKFASLLFDQIPNRTVVGTDWNAICWYFALTRLCLALFSFFSKSTKSQQRN